MHHVKEASWPPIVVPVVKSARCNQSSRWCKGVLLGVGGGGGGGGEVSYT